MARSYSISKRIFAGTAALISLGVLLAFQAVPKLPQADAKSAPQTEGMFTISDNVHLVLLEANVTDSKGGFITGLQKQNFKVLEDGQPRDISQFDRVDTPVTIGLVVDSSGSMLAKRPEVVMAGLAFAKQSNPADEFFVVNFNNSVVRGLPKNVMFTDKLQELRAALYYGQPAGQTALYDAIAYSLKHLEYAHLQKRTLIVVSDGGDNVSRISFPDLMQMIEASRATIYTVGIYEEGDRDKNPGIMKKIAAVSGGEFFEPDKLEDVLPVFNKIAQDIRNSYTIGYIPDELNDHHVIRSVRIVAQHGNRHLTVHTRTKYVITSLSEMSARISLRHEETRQ